MSELADKVIARVIDDWLAMPSHEPLHAIGQIWKDLIDENKRLRSGEEWELLFDAADDLYARQQPEGHYLVSRTTLEALMKAIQCLREKHSPK